MFLDSHRIVFTFPSWLDLLYVAQAFWISILKIFNYFQTTNSGLYISQASKTIGKLFRSYADMLSKFGDISFQEYVTEGISRPAFYDDLVYKLRRVRCEANFVSSGSKIVKRIRRRKYDPLIIKRTIGLVLGHYTAFYRSFIKHCTLTIIYENFKCVSF